MAASVKLAGQPTPRNVAAAFLRAVPVDTPGGAKAYHQGILSSAKIGALRRRGFITPGGTHITDPEGQRRTASLLTAKGVEALTELRRIEQAEPGTMERWADGE